MYLYPPNPQWPERFQQEQQQLLAASPVDLHLEHIGSTALPGLWSKNVLDILGWVTDIRQAAALIPAFIQLGYEYRGEHGIPGRQYFVKQAPLKVHLHIHQTGDAQGEKHQRFLAVLQAYPEKIAELNQLKLALAKKHPQDKNRYQDEKAVFYTQLLQLPLPRNNTSPQH
jgi:GrpB-like predicted nucleotidyltransferase (UPF0157 family)